MIQTYLPVAGTWSRKREDVQHMLKLPGPTPWYRRGSDFDMEMLGYSLYRHDQDGDPEQPDNGYWSGDLEGTLFSGKWWNPFAPKYIAWIEGAADLARTIQQIPSSVDRIWIIAHSHAGQVACYAIRMLTPAYARRVSLVTIDTPNRSGWAVSRHMEPVYETVARVIGGAWWHLHSEGGWEDRMRWMGARTLPSKHQQIEPATHNIVVDNHSCSLDVEKHREVWDRVFNVIDTGKQAHVVS